MSTAQQQIEATSTGESLDLKLDLEEVKGELALTEPTAIHADPEADPELEAKARQLADALTSVDPEHVENHFEAKRAVEEMGRALQTEAAHRSRMLQQPIRQLSDHGGEGGPVAESLVDLKLEVESLDPARFDFSPGWFSRLLGYLPGVGNPIKRYFTKFESSQTVIDAIIKSLENGREQLKRDNITLREDQRMMRELTIKIERQIKLGQLLDQHLEYKLSREVPATDPRHKFIQEELLFPLRQRIMDLQQQLAVNQQGVLATAMVMRNNTELVRGVNRAIDVTVSALQVAVTVALALANQKIVLDKVTAINETTSSLISGTAERLRTQGTAIHTQAASSMLDVDALKSAFADINAAMEEISRFRQEALPQMARTIVEFDELTSKGEEALRKMEAGEQASPSLKLDVD